VWKFPGGVFPQLGAFRIFDFGPMDDGMVLGFRGTNDLTPKQFRAGLEKLNRQLRAESWRTHVNRVLDWLNGIPAWFNSRRHVFIADEERDDDEFTGCFFED